MGFVLIQVSQIPISSISGNRVGLRIYLITYLPRTKRPCCSIAALVENIGITLPVLRHQYRKKDVSGADETNSDM